MAKRPTRATSKSDTTASKKPKRQITWPRLKAMALKLDLPGVEERRHGASRP